MFIVSAIVIKNHHHILNLCLKMIQDDGIQWSSFPKLNLHIQGRDFLIKPLPVVFQINVTYRPVSGLNEIGFHDSVYLGKSRLFFMMFKEKANGRLSVSQCTTKSPVFKEIITGNVFLKPL